MRAVVITEHGGPEVLQVRERPDPPVGSGEVRIAVKAAGINFADTLARTGMYPDSPKVPCVVGYEVAGEVESVGDGSSRSSCDRVLAGTRFNGQAELVTVRENMVYELPEQLSFEEGAAFPVNYATAQAGLVVMGGLKEGERVPDPRCGWRGGISATQIAKRIGAEVFGTASVSKRRDPRAGSRPSDRLPQSRLCRGGAPDHRRRGDRRGLRRPWPVELPQGLPVAPSRAADHVWGLGGADRGEAERRDRAADACQKPILVDALVEGARSDEREQGRLGLNMLSWWDVEGKPRPGD